MCLCVCVLVCACVHVCVCLHVYMSQIYLSLFRYLRDVDHHSIIYRQSDLDLTTVAGATCGSIHEDIRKEVLTMQESVIRDAEKIENERLKRQSSTHDPALVRCWLYALADYKFVQALTSAGDDPLGVMLSIILTVSISLTHSHTHTHTHTHSHTHTHTHTHTCKISIHEQEHFAPVISNCIISAV